MRRGALLQQDVCIFCACQLAARGASRRPLASPSLLPTTNQRRIRQVRKTSQTRHLLYDTRVSARSIRQDVEPQQRREQKRHSERRPTFGSTGAVQRVQGSAVRVDNAAAMPAAPAIRAMPTFKSEAPPAIKPMPSFGSRPAPSDTQSSAGWSEGKSYELSSDESMHTPLSKEEPRNFVKLQFTSPRSRQSIADEQQRKATEAVQDTVKAVRAPKLYAGGLTSRSSDVQEIQSMQQTKTQVAEATEEASAPRQASAHTRRDLSKRQNSSQDKPGHLIRKFKVVRAEETPVTAPPFPGVRLQLSVSRLEETPESATTAHGLPVAQAMPSFSVHSGISGSTSTPQPTDSGAYGVNVDQTKYVFGSDKQSSSSGPAVSAEDATMASLENAAPPITTFAPVVFESEKSETPDNWQHFRKVTSNIESNAQEHTDGNVDAAPMKTSQSGRPGADANDIDKMFEEYRQDREARARTSRFSASGRTLKSVVLNNSSDRPVTIKFVKTLSDDKPVLDERPPPQYSEAELQALKGPEITTYAPWRGEVDTPMSSRSDNEPQQESQREPRYDTFMPRAPVTASRSSGSGLSFNERVQRTLSSGRFGDLQPKREKPGRRQVSRDDDEDDDYYVSDRDLDDIDADGAGVREQRQAERAAKQEELRLEREAAARRRDHAMVALPDYTTAANLAQLLNVHYEQFILKLERLGFEDIFPGKVLNAETSGSIALEFGFDPIFASDDGKDSERDLHAQPEPEPEEKEYWPSRPPVVTIMGHVDHGKTTILDYLRKASVAAGEAGGITQHIGAFSVELQETGRAITFLDTPGHAAFLAMRQRGANVTDIVVLVVAADDSVKPQTLEALKHARSANVPIIVAINKVDKPEANIQQVKNDLGRNGVEIEEYGGETQVVEISGKTGQGMGDLEEAIVSQSEILDHRADIHGVVEGWVIEATTKPQGRVATVLVKRGTLKIGTIIVAGKTYARVRTLHDDNGQEIEEATPGVPVEITGWRDQPLAGDMVLEAQTEQQAVSVVDYRIELEERKKLAADTEAINASRAARKDVDEQAGEDSDDAQSRMQHTGPIRVPIIIKADVSGSAEALEAYILSISSPHILPQILYAEVGQINESDVERASVDKGVIVSFNQPREENIMGLATASGVKVLEHNIIYRALDDVKDLLEDRLPRLVVQKVTGEAEVAAAFEIGIGGRRKMTIAGCKVRNGVIAKTSKVRVMRDTVKVYEGTLSSLKNVKKDVAEMRKGSECGLAFENWEEFVIGDVVQTYSETTEKRTL